MSENKPVTSEVKIMEQNQQLPFKSNSKTPVNPTTPSDKKSNNTKTQIFFPSIISPSNPSETLTTSFQNPNSSTPMNRHVKSNEQNSFIYAGSSIMSPSANSPPMSPVNKNLNKNININRDYVNKLEETASKFIDHSSKTPFNLIHDLSPTPTPSNPSTTLQFNHQNSNPISPHGTLWGGQNYSSIGSAVPVAEKVSPLNAHGTLFSLSNNNNNSNNNDNLFLTEKNNSPSPTKLNNQRAAPFSELPSVFENADVDKDITNKLTIDKFNVKTDKDSKKTLRGPSKQVVFKNIIGSVNVLCDKLAYTEAERRAAEEKAVQVF